MLTSFAGGRLYGRTWGDPPATVLALHGWARDHRDFDAVLSAGPAGPEVAALAVDLPGFGSTPAPPEAWGSADYAEALVPLLDELDGPAVVVGHSFGGRVAVRLAAAAPSKVGRLVLTGVPLLPRAGTAASPSWRYRVGRRLHRMGLVGEERMEALRRRHGSPDYRAATGVMRDVFVRTVNERYDDDLDRLQCHVDLVWGGADTEVPVEVADRAAGRLAASTLTVLDGVGHLVPTEAPAALRRAVDAAVAAGRG